MVDDSGGSASVAVILQYSVCVCVCVCVCRSVAVGGVQQDSTSMQQHHTARGDPALITTADCSAEPRHLLLQLHPGSTELPTDAPDYPP